MVVEGEVVGVYVSGVRVVVQLVDGALREQAVGYQVQDTLSDLPVGVLQVPDRVVSQRHHPVLVVRDDEATTLEHRLPDHNFAVTQFLNEGGRQDRLVVVKRLNVENQELFGDVDRRQADLEVDVFDVLDDETEERGHEREEGLLRKR